MTELEIKEESKILQDEYNALKKHLGEMLLESTGQENPEDVAYFTRKFNEARQKLRKRS